MGRDRVADGATTLLDAEGAMAEDELPEGGNDHYYALPKGAALHEFEIVSVLGHGGFGITYKAMDTHLREFVAIKEYLPGEIAVRTSESTVRARTTGASPDFEAGLASFLEEARLIAAHRHPRIVDVRRFFKLNGTGYIVMQFESGSTLSQRLAEGPMPPRAAMAVLEGVLDGLGHLHDNGILHRDLKPGNVMLRPDGTPVIIDFGAARDFKVRSSRSVTSIATPGYAPPEQYGVGGQQGPWTDLYAVGAVAYKMATGLTPADSLRRLRKDPLVPAASLAPEGWEPAALKAIDAMMRIEEEDRPQSAQAVRELLAGTDPLPAPAREPVAPGARPGEAAPVPKSKGKRALAAALLLAIGLAGAGAWGYLRHQEGVAASAKLEQESAEGARRAEASRQSERETLRQRTSEEAKQSELLAAERARQASPATAERARAEEIERLRKSADEEASRKLRLEQERRSSAARAASYKARLENAGHHPAAVQSIVDACSRDSACDQATRDAIRARVVVIEEDDSDFEAAKVNKAKLADYLRTCRVCRHEDEARALIARPEGTPHLDRAIAAGHDLEKIEDAALDCRRDGACHQEQAAAIARRLADAKADRTAYHDAGTDAGLLRRYARECRICLHKDQALDLAKIYGAREAPPAAAGQVQAWDSDEVGTRTAQAGDDVDKLRAVSSACSTRCLDSVRDLAIRKIVERIRSIEEDETAFREAGNDPDRLRRFAATCKACVRKAVALQSADTIEALRRQFLSSQLAAAGRDEAKLRAIVEGCDGSCDRDLRAAAAERWNQAKADRERMEQASLRAPPPPPQSPTAPRPTSWDHNGSRMTLTASGSERKFTYAVPRDAIARQGVRPGTLLFDGNRNGDAYAGRAFVFKAGCLPLEYWTSGRVSHDQRSVTLRGNTPKRGDGCAVERYVEETLTFTLIGD